MIVGNTSSNDKIQDIMSVNKATKIIIKEILDKKLTVLHLIKYFG